MRIGDQLIREMVGRFDEIGSRFDLLAWIDREVVSGDLSIEQTIHEMLERSLGTFRAKGGSAIAVANETVLHFPLRPSSPRPVTLDSELTHVIVSGTKVDVHPTRDKNSATLIIPIFVENVSSLKIVLLYEGAWYGGETSTFHDAELKEFAAIVAEQCRILVSKRMQSDFEATRNSIIDAFFSARLDPERCWLELTRHFADFLPNWRPLRIEPAPQVQFLTYDDNKETIVLRAGTDQNGPVPPKSLLINETICGIAVEAEIQGRSPQALYVNPTESAYLGRFRSYLLSNIPQSELVIPVRTSADGGVTIKLKGLINLEHAAPKIFLTSHVEILTRCASFVAPFIDALLQEEQDQRIRSVKHLYMLHSILTKMAKTYRHKVGQYITATTLSLEALEEFANRLEGDERKFFDRLQRSVTSFAGLSKNFASGLPNYVQFGRTAILELVDRALNEFDPEELRQAEEIAFSLEAEVAPDTTVFGSPLLSEHLYNILYNSVDAVRSRLSKREIPEGKINIKVSIAPQQDKLKQEDSFPMILISINDNGGGLSADAEQNWGRARYTTKGKGGSGFGVSSAIEYLSVLGGKIDKENDSPNGLNVLIYIPTYVREVHVPLAHKLNINTVEGGE